MELRTPRANCPGIDTIAARACGQLGPGARHQVEVHMADCAACRDLAAALAGSVLTRLPTRVSGATAFFEPGTVIGRYRLTRLLGAGGMGVVYAAHDPELGRDVAVKVLHPMLADDPDHAGAFLLAEARAMARLRHVNVVAVHDAGTVDDRVYVAMELIAGQTLRDWLTASRPWSQVLEVLGQAGRGLAAAHAAGLVHRDFKPENVLLGTGGEVCVSDFGLALPVGAAADVAGTPIYMAPEQLGGAPLDARADQYAFGLVLCEALTGLRPDESVAASMPRDRVIPTWLRRVCARALAPDPARRFASMDELLERLDRRRLQVRRGIAAAALTAIGAVAIAARASAAVSAAPDPCGLAGQLPADVWGRARAAEVSAALTRHGAGDRAAHVTAALDGWRERWSSMRVGACRASKVRGTESTELFDLRMACLDREAGRVDALLDAVDGADVSALGGLTTALTGGDELAACAGDRALLEPWRAPADPAKREQAAQLGEALAAAGAAVAADRLVAGVDQARTVAAAAEQAGLPALRAEALSVAARGLADAGALAEAGQVLRDALEAAEAADHETAKVDVLLGLARADLWLDRFVESERDLRLAAAVGSRLHDPRVEARIAAVEAKLRWTRGEFEAALTAADRGLALRRGLGDASLELAELLETRSIILRRLGRFEESSADATTALDVAVEALGPGHPALSGYLVSRSDATLAIGQGPAALAYAGAALALVGHEHGMSAHHPAVAVAELIAQLGRDAEAVEVIDQAIARHARDGGGSSTAAEMYATRGRILLRLGREPEAVASVEHSLQLVEAQRGPESDAVSQVLETLGHSYLFVGRAADALAAAQRIVAIRRRRGPDGGPSSFGVEVLLGRAFQELGRPAEAIPHLEAALALPGQRDPLKRAVVGFALGQMLVDTGGDRDRAVALVRDARTQLAAAPELGLDLSPLDRWLAAHAEPLTARRGSRPPERVKARRAGRARAR